MSSFVSESDRKAILKETNPTAANTTIVMQISTSPPPGLSIPSGQSRPPNGQDLPISQAMATTTTPPNQDHASPTAHRRQSLAPEIPISHTMAKLTRQPSPPLPLNKPNPPTHLAPHQHRALTNTLRKAAQSIKLTKTTPLAFLDQVTLMHSNLLTIPCLPLPGTAKATIYDKLTLLPLLFHNNHILLLIPPHSTTGYKPPACTYNAANMSAAIGTTTMTDILESTLTDTLRLRPGRTFMPLVPPIHEPCFGSLRLPGQGVDVWIVAQIFEFLPMTEMEISRARMARGGGATGNRAGVTANGARGAMNMATAHAADTGMPRLRSRPPRTPNPEKVQVMQWFDEDMVRQSEEIDRLTRRILLNAFEGMRRVEREVEAAMSML